MNIPPVRPQRRARIEIIPLIDIIFFLLATFMMVSISMVQNRSLPVRLPAAASAAPQERKDSASITVTGAGTYAWDKEPVDLAGLAARLQRLKAESADPRVFIHGDAAARFEAVVAVLDATRQAGIGKIAIQTGPAKK